MAKLFVPARRAQNSTAGDRLAPRQGESSPHPASIVETRATDIEPGVCLSIGNIRPPACTQPGNQQQTRHRAATPIPVKSNDFLSAF
jgi:hypothetical protein